MKKTETALSALMSAAALLPIVVLPVTSHAQAPEQGASASILPVGATMGLRVLYYREPGERMRVSETVLWLKTPVAESWEVSLSGTLDILSGASPEIVSNRSGRPVQILTGSSGPITDRRRAGELAIKRKFGENTFGVSRSLSAEKDYTSYAAGADATFDCSSADRVETGLYESTTLYFPLGTPGFPLVAFRVNAPSASVVPVADKLPVAGFTGIS